MSRPWQRIPRVHAWVAVAALALYLPACWWGAPHATAADRLQSWGVDDATPLSPLAEVYGLFVPSPDRNLGYPILHPLLVATAYAPYMIYLLLTGRLRHPSGAFPFGLRDPVSALKNLSLIAHLVSVVLGAGVAVAAFDVGSTLWDRRTGFFAAAFAATAFPMFYYARTGNVDVPVLFFSAATLAVFARCLVGDFTIQRAVWLGLFGGGSLAIKEPAAAIFLSLPFVLLWLHYRKVDAPRKPLSLKFWRAPLACGASLVFAYGMGSGMFMDPERYIEHVQFVRSKLAATASGKIAYATAYPHTWDGNLALARALWARTADSMTLAGLLLALAGLGWVLRREPFKALFFLPAVTYLAVLFQSARIVQMRYVMPASFVLAFFAARGVTLALESHRRVLAGTFALVVAWALCLGLLRGLDLTYAMLNDSRYAASQWLAARTAAGAHIEYFGPTQKLPTLERGVSTSRAIEYLGAFRKARTGPEAAAEIVTGWKARRPDFIISMPDHSSLRGFEDSATCPQEIIDGLHDGRFGYKLGAKFETPPLMPWVRTPELDYPTVNPPIRIYAPAAQNPGSSL